MRAIERKQRTTEMNGLDYPIQLLTERLKGRSAHMLQMDLVGATTTMQRRPYELREGIALISIQGVLCNDAWYWDETEYDEIREEIQMALDDAEVQGILLAINSPGGETDNAFETADFIKAAGKTKPIWAAAAPIAYSAAYLLASQASRIYVPPITGGVGSIGVYMIHFDYSEMLKKSGITPTTISAGKGKTERSPYKPLSEAAQSRLQKEIDRLYGEFSARVATGRRTSESAIINLGAYLFEGSKAALTAGLADRAGSYENAWLDLGASVAKNRYGLATAAQTQLEGDCMDNPLNAPQQTAAAAPPAAPAPVAAAAAPPPAPAVAAPAAPAVPEAVAQEIMELCTIAGESMETALGFVKAKATPMQVRQSLLETRAKETDAHPVRSGILAHEAATDQNAATAAPKKSTAELMAEKLKREGRN
jgi:signal peptide peptidase SppA